jgi:hypothetical protein
VHVPHDRSADRLPALAVVPWITRITPSVTASDAKAQAADEATKPARPTISGSRRP